MKTVKRLDINLKYDNIENLENLIEGIAPDIDDPGLRLDTRFYADRGVAEYFLYDRDNKARAWAVMSEVYDVMPVFRFMGSISRNFPVKESLFREYKHNNYEKL